jgi:hypothetical protein
MTGLGYPDTTVVVWKGCLKLSIRSAGSYLMQSYLRCVLVPQVLSVVGFNTEPP